MFAHKSYLNLGAIPTEGTTPFSLFRDAYELSRCNYTFFKSIDGKGQVQADTVGGIIEIDMPMLPNKEILEWTLNSRKYLDGSVVFCDDGGIPLEKILFTAAACVSMEINYIKTGSAYVSTSIVFSTKTITVGRVTFESRWVNK